MCSSAHPVSGSAENEVAQITNGAKGTSKARHCTDFVMIAALQYSRNVLLCPVPQGAWSVVPAQAAQTQSGPVVLGRN